MFLDLVRSRSRTQQGPTLVKAIPPPRSLPPSLTTGNSLRTTARWTTMDRRIEGRRFLEELQLGTEASLWGTRGRATTRRRGRQLRSEGRRRGHLYSTTTCTQGRRWSRLRLCSRRRLSTPTRPLLPRSSPSTPSHPVLPSLHHSPNLPTCRHHETSPSPTFRRSPIRTTSLLSLTIPSPTTSPPPSLLPIPLLPTPPLRILPTTSRYLFASKSLHPPP